MKNLYNTCMKLIGPFSQVLTMQGLPLKGPLCDDALCVVEEAGVVVDQGKIVEIGDYTSLCKKEGLELTEIKGPCVLFPGFIDTHTHICYAGSRARDYALRVAGVSYLEIAKQGGGILDTVCKTREASFEELSDGLSLRCDQLLRRGVTTCEVKSGYGLNVDHEIKMLEVIRDVTKKHDIDLVSSCLAAHVLPPEFKNPKEYLEYSLKELLPLIVNKQLAHRVDVFVEEGAFSTDVAREYLEKARDLGFSIIVHADQFSTGGSELACEMRALSADHLEASQENEMKALAKAGVIATVLPGASLGLGMNFAPARQLLDHGCCVVIASDWNPGSAPMGDLLMQASVLGAFEKLSNAEVLAGITCRAAKALELNDCGVLEAGRLADMVAFSCSDYREVLCRQGGLKPSHVWKKGVDVT